jgi:hypothetical protein
MLTELILKESLIDNIKPSLQTSVPSFESHEMTGVLGAECPISLN